MIQRYVCALILLTFVFSIDTKAQDTRTVRGVVQGPDGTVVPDANVALTAAAEAQPRTTTTDEEGGFAIKNVPEGEDGLRVNGSGLQEAQVAGKVGSTALRRPRGILRV